VTTKPTNVTGTTRRDLDGLPAVIADGLVEALRVVDAAALPDDLRPLAFARAAGELIPRLIVEHAV
jgi:hypothetical protein